MWTFNSHLSPVRVLFKPARQYSRWGLSIILMAVLWDILQNGTSDPPHYWDAASLPMKTSCCPSVCLQTSSSLEFLWILRVQKESWRKQRPCDRFGEEVFTCKSKTKFRFTSPRAADARPAVPSSFLAKGYLILHFAPLFGSRGNLYSFNSLDTSPVSPARIFCVLTAPSPPLLSAHRAKTLVQVWGQFRERWKRWLSWERENKVTCGLVQKCRCYLGTSAGQKFPLSN